MDSQSSIQAAPHRPLLSLLAGLLFAAGTLGLMALFTQTAAPPHQPPYVEPRTDYDRGSMHEAVGVDRFTATYEAILAHGSRYTGQPGHEAVRRMIVQQWTEAGLEVHQQPFDVLTPVTVQRQVLDERGRPLQSVEILPFSPMHFQPQVTPEQGITGRLMRVDDETRLKHRDFSDAIAVVDFDELPGSLELYWPRYAQLGFKALIVTHRDGLDQIKWRDGKLAHLSDNTPVNYVRLAASQGILDHLGRTVTLKVRTEWRNVQSVNVVGVLRARADGQPAQEAIIVAGHYDALSMLPDRAPGTLTAYNLAAMMSLAEGLEDHRGQMRRDVFFVATSGTAQAGMGTAWLHSAMGPRQDPGTSHRRYTAQLNTARQQAAHIAAIRECLDDQAFGRDLEATRATLKQLDAKARDFFDEQFTYVMNTLAFELNEPYLQRRLDFYRAGNNPESAPAEYERYLQEKAKYDKATSVLGLDLLLLLGDEHKRPMLENFDVRRRLVDRFADLATYEARRIGQCEAALTINELFAGYDETITVWPHIMPRTDAQDAMKRAERTAFYFGDFRGAWAGRDLNAQHGPGISTVWALSAPASGDPLAQRVEIQSLSRDHARQVAPKIDVQGMLIQEWNSSAYLTLGMVNTDRLKSYQQIGYPFEVEGARQTQTVAGTLRVLGNLALSMAYGNGRIESQLVGQAHDVGGTVLVGGIGRSIVPDYPLAGALIGSKGNRPFVRRGQIDYPFLLSDPYGEYWLPQTAQGIGVHSDRQPGYSPNAAWIGPDGMVRYIKDEGEQGQTVFRSSGLSAVDDGDNVRIVCFRAAPVTVLDQTNPQTLKPYSSVNFLDAKGLGGLISFNSFDESSVGVYTRFTIPEQPIYITLQAGAADNELVQVIRAFMLGIVPGFEPSAGRTREINGPGYLPVDHRLIDKVPQEIARSMTFLNGQRLALLDRYAMSDERAHKFHDRAGDFLEQSQQTDVSELESTLAARDAVTYAELNHPVLRHSIREAVISIIWYLCLLVPFVFFFEKLAFGFNDVRKQLAAVAAIFLIAFVALRMLHPAFEMIRSSLMILLGFIIVLIAGGISLLFSGKFKENFEQLKAKRGQVSAAEVNTMGVVGTAFMLGLNNMHRRKVRTGLTCGTLVLITFAMICFTSIQSDLVDSEVALGKAHYQGLLVKNEDLAPISNSEVFALGTRFGHKYNMVSRRVIAGAVEQRDPLVPDLRIENGQKGAMTVDAVLIWHQRDPLARQLRFVTERGWFDAQTAETLKKDEVDVKPIIIAQGMAERLMITPQQVDRERVVVDINGLQYWIYSICQSDSLKAATDVDGRDPLPWDVTAMKDFRFDNNRNLVLDEPFVRVLPDDLIVALDVGDLKAGRGINARTVSVVVELADKDAGEPLAFKPARQEIDTYLEQSGRQTYYGLDGVAYRGLITRQSSFSGLLDLIIPLIIAALTVLNTIKGSVYERRDEIFVYNAVGIAPRYVFFMFFAEAFVYAVVGSVAGYLLSQGTGRILTELDLTGGLNMTFTSTSTIYASLAIMVAVFASTLFPALSAVEIAAPAEESGWDLPEPEGDTLTIRLPFTFDKADRLAVLQFFYQFFEDHGEGSSGAFYCADLAMGLSDQRDELADGAYIPELTAMIWLKPFDLGVSQKLSIAMPTDSETGEFIALLTLTRLSGTRESWVRLNHAFLKRVRKHFLHWRAVGPDQRHEMFTHAKQRLAQLASANVGGGAHG